MFGDQRVASVGHSLSLEGQSAKRMAVSSYRSLTLFTNFGYMLQYVSNNRLEACQGFQDISTVRRRQNVTAAPNDHKNNLEIFGSQTRAHGLSNIC